MTDQRRSPSQRFGKRVLTGSDAGQNEGDGRGDDGMVVLSYIITGVVLYGGIGWLVARWLHTTWPLPIGIIVGLAASTYLIIKRYGSAK